MSNTLPTDPSELIKHFRELSKTLDDQYDTTHDLKDLHESLAALQSALSVLPADDADNARRADLVARLYKGLHRCYQHTGATEYLDGATQYAKETVGLTQGTRAQVQHLADTAVFMSMKHARTGLLAEIEGAVTYCELALAVMSELDGEGAPNAEERASTCSKACLFFERKYMQTADIGDLQMAVRYGREAVESSGRASALYRSGRVNNLAKQLWTRYQLLGDIEDLREAAVCCEDLMETMPQDHPEWSRLVLNVVNFLRVVYKGSKDVRDLRKMVAFSKRRVEMTPRLHPGREVALVELCHLMIDDYMQIGDLKAIGEAVKYAREVLELMPPGHPNRAEALSDLGSYLAREYEDTGDLETLDQAIRYNEEAVALNDPTVNRANHLSMISLSLGLRYERKGDLDDLRRAILYAKEGITVANQWENYEARIPIMHNLPKLQYMMFKRAATQENLEEMIICAEAAVEQTPPGEPTRFIPLSGLATCLEAKYYYTRDRADLLRATEIMEELLAVELPGDKTRYKFMSNLSIFLAQKNLVGEKDELEMKKALCYAEEALSAVPKDHTDRASFLVNLGVTRIEALGGADEDSERLFIEAWECYHSAPLPRINGARYAAGILAEAGKWEESSQILEDAIRMLPKVSTRSLEGQDKQQLLLKISGLPTTAACVALQAGRSAYHALGLLELSRGIIIGSTIDYRGDISDLKGRHPETFQKLEELRMEIDTPLPDSYESHAAGSRSFQTEEAYLQVRSRAFKRREEALQEMEGILKEIRRLPGCERFQLAPSEEELKSWAKDGPVVTFVSSSYRSDAIILTSSSITALPLPDLHYGDMKDRLDAVFGAPAKKVKKKKKRSPAAEMREYAESNQKMREMLLWLWNVAVKPVLQHLEIVDEHGNSAVDKPPHVWWIGTGRLSMAPFHAAGDHTRGSTENALSHVISSYTPTIKALSYARGKRLGIFSKPDPRLLLVSMTKTPGGAALPDAAKEVEGIMDITKGLVCKHLEHPSAEDVLGQFGSFEVMHFACHGVSNAHDPSESHLMLQRDSSSTAADRLTVAAISRRKARAAQIAYLSACSTADNAAAQLADEIIHIASGFQLAGFNHVLATMWPAESVVCTKVAVAFYRVLFGGGGSGGSGGGGEEEGEGGRGEEGEEEEEGGHLKVSRAMREAVLEARERDPLLPRKWAPFIHLGA